MEASSSVSAEFWTRVAEKYDRVVDRQIGLGARERVRDCVARERDLGVLAEFGCGTGYYTDALASRSERVLATDLSPGMLEIARQRVRAHNVTFRVEDCQHTTLADAELDTAFMSLVLHFTEPPRAVAEMRRVLKPGGVLIVANLDPLALRGLDLVRARARIIVQGVAGYRIKPPAGLGANVMSEAALRALLVELGFRIERVDAIRDPARPSNIPIEYVRAIKTGA
jgi:ubiquinone/menaquinone biosynthesis C-methylase UbiE